MVLITSKGLVIILGCSHVGVVNIISSISKSLKLPIYAVLGGTHLVEADHDRLEKTLAVFQKMNVQKVAVSHCTGEEGICFLKKECGDKFVLNTTWNVLTI